ncbi:hypothetical protein [Desertivirga brevis]|uniref:hypothetical protein n=1 Tax=Desertivirga brevis TaxID=2810310 RepID=UPI001A96F2E2|nr:hypothetical protein [Pedobacter sp. SYSU D00873]
MIQWEPIPLANLYDKIQKTETDLNGEVWNFWQLIKTSPTKWGEKEFGGFWVYGQIEGYYCSQDELG